MLQFNWLSHQEKFPENYGRPDDWINEHLEKQEVRRAKLAEIEAEGLGSSEPPSRPNIYVSDCVMNCKTMISLNPDAIFKSFIMIPDFVT